MGFGTVALECYHFKSMHHDSMNENIHFKLKKLLIAIGPKLES